MNTSWEWGEVGPRTEENVLAASAAAAGNRAGTEPAMNAAAKLSELMDSMEVQSEEWIYRYDRTTGQVAMVERSTCDAIDAGDDGDLDETDEEVALARAMVEDSGERFIDLPDKFDFHEYRQLERFIGAVEDSRVADELWRAIKGKGAFRYFKAPRRGTACSPPGTASAMSVRNSS